MTQRVPRKPLQPLVGLAVALAWVVLIVLIASAINGAR
jgi:hypothetical protein